MPDILIRTAYRKKLQSEQMCILYKTQYKQISGKSQMRFAVKILNFMKLLCEFAGEGV